MSSNLLILGIDALDPDFFTKHRDALPNLDRLAKGGAYGRLRSTVPPFTGPAWTAAFSGMNPGKTGILSFTEAQAGGQKKVMDSRDVMVPRMWNLLSQQKKKTAVVGVPMAYPVEKINGMMVGGFMTPPTEGVVYTYPTELQVELEQLGYEPNLDLRVDTPQEEYVRLLYETSKIKFDQSLKWLQEDQWDCFIIVMSEPDWIQHRLDLPEGNPQHEHNESELLRFFQYIDQYVAQFIEAAGEDAYILACSDHGFGHFIEHNVHINRYLVDQGYLKIKKDLKIQLKNFLAGNFRNLARIPGYRFLRERLSYKTKLAGLALTANTEDDVDWSGTKAYFQHSMWIMGKVTMNRSAFDTDEALDKTRNKLLKELKELRDPTTKQLIFREVYLREEAFRGPYAEEQADIICLFSEGYGGNNVVGSQLIVHIPVAGVPGASHRQDGIWIMSGPDIQTGYTAQFDLQDVAPLSYHILQTTGLADMDGQVDKKLFKEGSPLANYDCPTDPFRFLKREFVSAGENSDELLGQQLIVDHLQSLGYIE